MRALLNRKVFSRLEIRIAIITIAITGFVLGLSFVYTSSVKNGFYVSVNIVGESMHKTLDEDSKILFISHKVRKIRRGDIVHANAYKYGGTLYFEGSQNPLIIVKRVIALPGETISIKGNRVYINGVLLDEPYAYYEYESSDDMTVTLGDDQYFLMGDNRVNSADSRDFDFSDSESILGVALIIR